MHTLDDASAFALAILETVDLPLLALDGGLRVEVVNDAFLRQFDVTREATTGRLVYELGNGQWDIPELRRLLGDILPSNSVVKDYRVEHAFEGIGRRVMRLNARRIERAQGGDRVLLAIADETERERLGLELEGRIEFADKLVDSVREALLILHRDLRVHSANQPFYDMFRVDRSGIEGCLVYELGNRQWNIPELRLLLEDVLPRNKCFDDYEVRHTFDLIGPRVMLLNGRRLDHLDLILLAIRDVTAEREMERARIERERSQDFTLRLVDALRALSDPGRIILEAARVLCEELAASRAAYYEISDGNYVGITDHVRGVTPLTGRYPIESFGGDLLERHKQGQTIVVPDVSRSHTASELETLEAIQVGAYIGVPLVKEGRFIAGITVHSADPRDWTNAEVALAEETAERTWAAVERARAEQALKESEARLAAVVDNAPIGIGMFDREGRWIFMNPILARSQSSLIPSRDSAQAGRWHAVDGTGREVPPESWPGARALRGEVVVPGMDCRIEAGGEEHWRRITAAPVPGAEPVQHAIAIVEDITEQKRAEEHRRLLMREVNHRAKNMLSLIQAIAHQTVVTSPEDFVERFDERICSLAAAHDLLVRNEWRAVPLSDLLRSQLAHFSDLIGRRILLEGPPILLTPEATQAIGMAVHELATNAAKYGALSTATGCVDISWRVDPGRNGATFVMLWRESGGPAVAKPARSGFGSSLICAAVEMNVGASVSLDFAPQGVTWQMSCDAKSVIAHAFLPLAGSRQASVVSRLN